MKKSLLFLAALAMSTLVFSQSATIALSKDTLCAGESVMAEVSPPEYELSTPTGTNNQNGYMFDVTANYAATITGFEIDPVSSGATFYLYYRTGSHVGHENSATGWTMLDSVTNVPSGLNNPGFSINQSIVAGQTLAFYITSNGINYVYYDNGTSVGTTLASDSYLTIKEGVGKAYPFGQTYSPRNFVGSVLYEPDVSSYSWNTGQSSAQVNLSPQRSAFLSCNLGLSGGFVTTAFATVHVLDLMVDVSADPMVISSGQSSTLKADVELDRGIATDPSSTNSQNGAMFDLQASDSVVITGFTVSSTLDTGTTNIEIFYKTGTHVGSEGNSNAWTSIGTYNGVSEGDGIYLALNTPLTIIAGQTLAFYITSTDGSRLHYGNGTGVGNVYASAGGLKLLEGKGLVYPFGTTYSPRILATIVHYTVKNVTNATYNWSSGGSSASVVVSPSNSTNYTVDVGLNGCSETGSVSVGIIGINEDELASYEVYPNPAHDFINVSFNGSHKEVTISLFDLTGRVVYTKTVAPDAESTVIPVNNMPKGLYLLKLEQNASMRVFRIEVL